MEDTATRSIKKTVVLHPLMDRYVRKIWAILIEDGYEATYSMALNFMLLAAIQEGIKDGGLADETRKIVWAFADDQATISQLNLQDHVSQLRGFLGVESNNE